MSKSPRGQRPDGDATRARILDAAGSLFAVTGYAETTNKAVAAQADVDLASINYHFGSRNGLYQAALIEAHRRLIDVTDLRQLVDSAMTANAKLVALIELLVPRPADGPNDWHLQVLAREILAPSSHIEVLFQSELMPKLMLVRGLMSEITGIPVKAPALTRCMLSLAAPCLMLLIANQRLPGPLREVAEMGRQDLIEHFHTYALAGLTAVGQQYKGDQARLC